MKEIRYSIGIDSGKQGGLCILKDKDLSIADRFVMPLDQEGYPDVHKLYAIFSKYKNSARCLLEQVHGDTRFGNSNFSFGRQYGNIVSALKLSKISYSQITAQKWQKDLLNGVKAIKKPDGKNNTKVMASIKAGELFPDESFLATGMSKKRHEGLIDATLIAVYARNKL